LVAADQALPADQALSVDPEELPALQVQMWADVLSPWCYLGKRRLEHAVHAFEHPAVVHVRYRSCELDPDLSRGAGRPLSAFLAQWYGVRGGAGAVAEEVAALAAGDDLALDLDRAVTANTFDAHRLVQLALASGGPAEQSAVLERLFAACLSEGRAVDDRATLQRLAAEAGLDERRVASVLAADDYAREVRDDGALAARLGVSDLPHLLVNDEFELSGAQSVETIVAMLREAWTAQS